LQPLGRWAKLAAMDPQYQQQPGYGPPGYGAPMQQQGANGMAIASLVCSLVGLLIAGFILGPLAIIFGALGIGKANKMGGKGKGMAIAGLIIGCVDVLLIIVILAMFSGARRF
jgi:hypothetical protein